MTMNLRCDGTFVQDVGWYAAAGRYQDFLQKYERARVVYVELGVGGNTPGIIKYPFWKLTKQNTRATYICVNDQEAYAPREISPQAICIKRDIGEVLRAVV